MQIQIITIALQVMYKLACIKLRILADRFRVSLA